MESDNEKSLSDLIKKDFFHNNRGEPQMHRSVVAFVDVLGFTDLVKNGSNDILREFHEALSSGLKESNIYSVDNQHENFLDNSGLRKIKIFSDNIVLIYPIIDDAEMELGRAFNDLAELQMLLSCKGYFLRGAITIGDIFIDETTIFGPALIEAYHAENSEAIFPRIILTQEAKDAVSCHLKYYGDQSWAPQNRDLFKDIDGNVFINYLDTILIAEDEAGPFLEYVRQHKAQVSKALSRHVNSPHIFAKYLWSATYHNYFCEEYRHYPDLLIDLKKYQISPSRLID